MKYPLVSLALCLSTPAAAEFALNILHTNDFHARFEPINEFDSTCAEKDNIKGMCFGGSARLATAIAEARHRLPNTVLLDGGDQFQGTLFYTHYKGRLTAEMMNRLGYDAMTVGNHEFDDGPEGLAGFMDAVEFPVLMSNADVSREPLLKDRVLKSTVIEIAGEQIGLIGLTPENNHEISSPGDHIHFTDPVSAVQSETDALTARGINKIIVLSHSGYGIDLEVARLTQGVDVIVGGHTNTYLSSDDPAATGPYPTMVGNTAVVQAYAYGKFLGVLNLRFDGAGDIVSATGGPLLMDASVTEAEDVKSHLAQAAIPLDALRQSVVGEAVTAINGARAHCRFKECPMGNLVADAMLARVREQGIEIALTNGGGLRASLDEGPITMGEILTVLPFQNTLSTFRLDGATILAALEHGAGMMTQGHGRFLQVSGLRFSIAVTAPAGARIRDVLVGGVPLDPDASYGVVANSFMRGGGDGYVMLAQEARNAYDFGPMLADVVAEYLTEVGPYTAYTDGRITVVID